MGVRLQQHQVLGTGRGGSRRFLQRCSDVFRHWLHLCLCGEDHQERFGHPLIVVCRLQRDGRRVCLQVARRHHQRLCLRFVVRGSLHEVSDVCRTQPYGDAPSRRCASCWQQHVCQLPQRENLCRCGVLRRVYQQSLLEGIRRPHSGDHLNACRRLKARQCIWSQLCPRQQPRLQRFVPDNQVKQRHHRL